MSHAQPARILLVYGNQDYLIKEDASQYRTRVLQGVPIDFGWQCFDVHELLKMQGDQSAGAILDTACLTQPFGCERYVVQVDRIDLLKQKGIGQDILSCILKRIEALPEGLYLLLTAHVEKESELSAELLKALQDKSHDKSTDPHTETIRHLTHEHWNPVPWLQKEAKKRNIILPTELANLLAELAGNDLRTLSSALDKLALFPDDVQISEALLVEVIQGGKAASVFEVVEHLGQKNLKQALNALQRFWRQYPRAYPLLLGALARQFRQLLQLRSLQKQGEPNHTHAAHLKLPLFVLRKLEGRNIHFTSLELVRILYAVAEIDLMSKLGNTSLEPCLFECIEKICSGQFKNVAWHPDTTHTLSHSRSWH